MNWENLPTKRDPNQVESSHYGYGNWNWKKEHNTNNWRSRDFDYHDDWYESDYGQYSEGSYFKDSIGDKYDWIINKFLESDLEYWELQFIKENYLDMESDYDKYFYEYLLDELYAKNSYDY
ncbi:MAG: hypothetical protein EB079_00605 [Verrucomicrobia bacterium]|nr:hypothetical protein [Verrucomicrobiota bacterium]